MITEMITGTGGSESTPGTGIRSDKRSKVEAG